MPGRILTSAPLWTTQQLTFWKLKSQAGLVWHQNLLCPEGLTMPSPVKDLILSKTPPSKEISCSVLPSLLVFPLGSAQLDSSLFWSQVTSIWKQAITSGIHLTSAHQSLRDAVLLWGNMVLLLTFAIRMCMHTISVHKLRVQEIELSGWF